MVKDKRSNVVIVSASQTGNTRTIEGYRPLDNCEDQTEDIYLEGEGDKKPRSWFSWLPFMIMLLRAWLICVAGDILKLFYMMGSNIYDEERSDLDIDMNKKSQFGSDFLTIHTRVERNFEKLHKRSSLFLNNCKPPHPKLVCLDFAKKC